MKTANLSALALVISAGLFGQSAFAADGIITFDGEITTAPCSLSSRSQDLVVPLGSISSSQLSGAVGKRSTPTNFVIELVGCGATAKGATVTFSGGTDANVPDDLVVGLGVVNPATGVAVELSDSSGLKIPLGVESARYTLVQGTNPLHFRASYVSTRDSVTAGSASAAAQFTINYK